MSNEFQGSFYENLRTVITLVDHLRDSGLQKYIKLPRIAVLGTQSSGKSSVLESIVGIELLPRGEGVCTRRPLELRMVHTADQSAPSAKFDGNEKVFTNFTEVRQQIEALTDEVAGRNKGIIDEPIILTVYSNTCPDLTIIDLPGITRIPLAGSDQPEDIEKITKEMAYRYVSDPRTIILCVVPANADISTSEAIQMAKKVDNPGIRTLGVLTKIDIMDRGTSAKKLILGQEVPLRLGYVAIKNRSQQDILDNMTVKEALEAEKRYFQEHEQYQDIANTHTGTYTLSEKLTKILFTHIKQYLPDIMKEITIKLREAEDRLKELGPSAPTDSKNRMQLLWNMITDFCETYKNTIRGKYDRRRNSKLVKDLAGGLKIREAFGQVLCDFTGGYYATQEYTDEDIRGAIQKHEGDTIPGFPSADVFVYLLQPIIERLKEPTLDTLNEIHSFLETLAHQIIERVFFRFPSMVHEICDVASRVIYVEKEKCQHVVECIVDAEEGYCFTNDINYLSNRTDLIPKNEQKKAMDSQDIFINEIRQRIDAYFSIVIRGIRDQVPKAIGYWLVRASIENMHIELYKHINQNEALLESLNEPSHIAAERKTVKAQVDTLRTAQKLIKRDPSLAAQNEAIEQEIAKEQSQAQAAKEAAKAAPAAKATPPPAAKPVENKSLFGTATPKVTGDSKKSLF